MLPVIVLVIVSAAAGLLAWVATRAALRRSSDARAFALVTIGLTVVVLVGLGLVVRRGQGVPELDFDAAHWAHEHATSAGHRALRAISLFGSDAGVIVVGAAVGSIEYLRLRNRWIPVFLVVVALGDSLIDTTIKHAVDRARPTYDPAAAALGPAFPSGHSSTAAAFYAALALLAWRLRPAAARALLAGGAVAIAVAVACSRVMLDLHWLTDVVGGLALGWAWFALCALVFGRALGFREYPGQGRRLP